MKKILFVLLAVAIFNFYGCTITNKPVSQENKLVSQENKPVSKTSETPVEQKSDNQDIDDFAIRVKNTSIMLDQWDNKISLSELLGKPKSEDIKKLGPGSDTFTGSFVKELRYKGLVIELFSPKENGKTFWISGIKTNIGDYQTVRGIKVGDGIEKLKKSYPDISVVLDERTDPNNCAYRFLRGNYYYIVFEVTGGKITEINIYHEAP